MMLDRRSILRAGGYAATLAVPSASTLAKLPDDRIATAMAVIEAALAEKYPGWRIQRQDEAFHRISYRRGSAEDLGPMRHVVMIYAGEDDPVRREEPRLYVHTTDRELEA